MKPASTTSPTQHREPLGKQSGVLSPQGPGQPFFPSDAGTIPGDFTTRQYQLLTMRAYFSELQARFPSQTGNSFNSRGKSLVSRVSSV